MKTLQFRRMVFNPALGVRVDVYLNEAYLGQLNLYPSEWESLIAHYQEGNLDFEVKDEVRGT